MDYEYAAPVVAQPAVEVAQPPPQPAPEAPEAQVAPAEASAAAGPVDGEKALQLFGHYADSSTPPDEAPLAQPISRAPDDPHDDVAPPAPGVTCNQGVIQPQSGAGAYSAEGLQEADKLAAAADPTFKTDPDGATQRARAHRELADKFQVVDASYSGPRNSNTLTQEQYDQVCATYSNIRMGKGDLTMDTSEMCPEDAVAYRDGVMKDIGTLMQTETGRKEVEKLTNNEKKVEGTFWGVYTSMLGLSDGVATEHRHTTIKRRHQDNNGDGNNDNDDDQPLSRTNASTQAFDQENKHKQFVQADGTPGDGTDQVIRFNPGINLPHDVRDDVALAHEMVHAIQGSQGTQDPTVVGKELGPPNSGDPLAVDRGLPRWEHQAAGLGRYASSALSENAYRRERHQLGVNVAKGALQDDVDIQHRDTYNDVKTSPFAG